MFAVLLLLAGPGASGEQRASSTASAPAGSAIPGLSLPDPSLPPSSQGAPEAPTLLPANARSGILGVWIRPDRRAAADVLTPLKEAGYTDVFVEAFYHGMTIYPSRVAPQRPEFAGRDVLDEYGQAAARLGLRLHAWVEVLYWRPPERYGVRGGLLGSRPEWETLDASGRPSRLGKLQMGFADPAVYQVRQTVYALARELGAGYARVGLHLDYLRYPAGGDFGYHPDARRAFRQMTGAAPSRADPRWYAFRQDVLTQVANGMSRAYRDAGGQGLVTAAVNPEYPFYKTETLQVWPKWAGVDVFVPMAYSPNVTYLKLLSRYVRARSSRPVWMGLLVGDGYPPLAQQVSALRQEGYSNFVVFGLR